VANILTNKTKRHRKIHNSRSPVKTLPPLSYRATHTQYNCDIWWHRASVTSANNTAETQRDRNCQQRHRKMCYSGRKRLSCWWRHQYLWCPTCSARRPHSMHLHTNGL